MTRLSSSQHINAPPTGVGGHAPAPPPPPLSSMITVGGAKWGVANVGPTRVGVSSGGVTVTTISPPRMPRPLSQGPLTLAMGSQACVGGVTVTNSQVRILLVKF